MIGKGYRARLLNPYDEFWDRRLGVHTFGFRPASGSQDAPDWRLHYVPSSYSDIFFLLKSVGLNRDDTFIDLGGGMGRVVFAASWAGAHRAIGVDILTDLTEVAEDNRRKSRLADRDISFVCQNAKDADLAGATVIFIFHSFGADTMRAVLDNIKNHAGNPLRIIYMNPVFNSVLGEMPWLRQRALIQPPRRYFSNLPSYKTAIWEMVAS